MIIYQSRARSPLLLVPPPLSEGKRPRVPSPSCPAKFLPQHCTVPVCNRAQICAPPAASAVAPLSPGTATGVALTAAAEERLRIARDLHDDAVQQVYSIVLLLKGALRHSADEGGRQEVQRVYAQAVQTWEGLRRYLRDLRDPLDTRTFSERLRQGADAFTRLTGIPVDLDLDEVDLPEETGLQMLAITREALSNVYRHARARSVALRLRVVDETLMLEIADDGVGFDPQAVTALEGGYGLRGIAERVALLDGAWNIVSQPGQGTRVQVHLPFRPAPLEEEEKAE